MHIHPARKQPSSLQDIWTLHNGVAVPVLGLGTYKSLGDSALYAVSEALQFGYRHVDTAAYYGNLLGFLSGNYLVFIRLHNRRYESAAGDVRRIVNGLSICHSLVV